MDTKSDAQNQEPETLLWLYKILAQCATADGIAVQVYAETFEETAKRLETLEALADTLHNALEELRPYISLTAQQRIDLYFNAVEAYEADRHERPTIHETNDNIHVLVGGQILRRTHSPDKCAGQYCTIHNFSDHHMVDWPQNWRGDRAMMERICPHGIGHPDPDEINYDEAHGCDGCCINTEAHDAV